ncbi:transporter [Marinicauda pacifica]|jgi:neurotransmitter:Na+ symporter, NSS family|uniref:Sodium-dependent transporter n=1 Tax=Marinicauda pacifica TaxID=1133559 RepID=A0A4S2H7L9_9PROT|nr:MULTISPECIES: sodium-dependent transporter [Marinicauda]TGY91810.1 sodium-dependent transporter [Marinicauda pacifica]GGE50634.1 transporter [Marinicauda pacifica]
MASLSPGQHAHWSSRFAFVMAAVGSSVGLGNLWRFPFQTGENGGSAFVLVYLFCVALVAYPVLNAELSIGRNAQLSAVGATRKMAHNSGASTRWSIVGWFGMIGAFLILCTYSVIAGQVMAFSAMGFLGEFGSSPVGEAPVSLYNSIPVQIFWHSLFIVLTVLIVARGLKGGIEQAVTILMPLFFVMLIGLSVFSLLRGDALETLNYLFAPDFTKITPGVVLAALGQALFSVSVGSAIMITYGSYLPRSENLGTSSAIIAGSDTLVALIAGLMIFPIVFLVGIDPASGMGLIFNALPAVFADMAFGNMVGGAFFFLAFIAALTSSISLLQVIVAWAEEHTDMSAGMAATVAGALVWMVGVGAVYSPVFGGAFVDVLSGEIFLPITAFLVAVFAGWVIPKATMRHENSEMSEGVFSLWRFLLRYVCPIVIGAILVLGLNARFGVFGG